MDVLKAYLKSLPDDDAREAFAGQCATTLGHMRNCIYVDGKHLAPAVCVLVEKHSEGAIRRWDLRPDWADIWPELIGADGAPPPFPNVAERSVAAADASPADTAPTAA